MLRTHTLHSTVLPRIDLNRAHVLPTHSSQGSRHVSDTGGGLGLTRKQIEVFAAGLYHIAACDGVEERELDIIREFLADAGAPDLSPELAGLTFDPVVAYNQLESTWLRSLFLRAALLVVRQDGEVSDAEVETIDWMAEAFGVQGGYKGLIGHLEGEAI